MVPFCTWKAKKALNEKEIIQASSHYNDKLDGNLPLVLGSYVKVKSGLELKVP